MKISIVIPIYNERENIDPLYRALTAALTALSSIENSYEIVFANDGSADGSDRELDALAQTDPKVKVIHLKRNYGQTAALMAAIQFSSGEIIISMDGDQQNDPADIPHLLETLDQGYDVVSGWRVNRKEGVNRRLPSRIANWLISKVSGVPLHDYGCTLKAYRRQTLADVRLYGEMHRFIPIYAAWEGGRVTEIPVTHHDRKFGTTNYGLARAPRVLLDLLVIRFLGSAIDRPIQFFGLAGLLTFLFAVLAGLWALYLKVFEGVSFILTPLPLLVVMLVLVGFVFIMIGLLGEIQSRIYYESQGKRPFSVRDTRNLQQSAGESNESANANGPL